MGDNKPVAVVLPSWDKDSPRFRVETCSRCGDDRQFKNGKVVYNQRLGMAYSVDEIVEVFNTVGMSLDNKSIIREKYLNLKNGFTDDKTFTKAEAMEMLESIAKVLDVDLKEYPKVNLNELLMCNGDEE